MFKKLFSLLKTSTVDHTVHLTCDESGVSFLRQGKREMSYLAWTDISEISAFKRDEVTTDLVCLEVVDVKGRKWLLHEEMHGFDRIEKAILTTLPLDLPHWREVVIPKAFKDNRAVIYKKRH